MKSAESEAATLDPRVWLAAERTLLAWVRTALALMGFGFVVARFGVFLHELAQAQPGPAGRLSGASLWLGTALVVLGILVNIAAAFQHVRRMRTLLRGEPLPNSIWSLGVLVTLLLAVIGMAMTAFLLIRGVSTPVA